MQVTSLLPGDGSYTPTLRPAIGANTNTALDPNSVELRVDGALVSATTTLRSYFYNQWYEVRYTPAADLAPGLHTARFDYKDTSGQSGYVEWSFTLSADGPTVTPISVSDGATATLLPSGLRWDARAWDPDGVALWAEATFTVPARSYVATDVAINRGYLGSQYLFVYHDFPSNAPEGLYEIEVSVKDEAGYVSRHDFTFTAYGALPEATIRSPQGAVSETTPTIWARLTDTGSGIDHGSVEMSVDGTTVAAAVATTTGDPDSCDVVFEPSVPLSPGQHDVVVVFADGVGQTNSASWSFTVETTNSPPALSGFSPAPDAVADGDSVVVSVDVTDGDGLALGSQSMSYSTPAGTATVAPTLTLSDGGTVGALTYTISESVEMVRDVVVSVADSKGATATASWSFTQAVDVPYVVSTDPERVYRAGSFNGTGWALEADTALPTVTIRVRDDTSGIDQGSLVFSVAGSPVPYTVSTVDSKTIDVSWTATSPLSEAHNHEVRLDYADGVGRTNVAIYQLRIWERPTWSEVTPPSGSTVTSEAVALGVRFYDRSGIDTETVQFKYDNETVEPTITLLNGGQYALIQWTAVPYVGPHSVSVRVTDSYGRVSDLATWSFTFEMPAGFSEMSMFDNGACAGCHVSTTDVSGWDSLHEVRMTPHKGTCMTCHGPIYSSDSKIWSPEFGCDVYCHDEGRNSPPQHGGEFIPYVFLGRNNSTKYGLTQPREALDCTYCHQHEKPRMRIQDFSLGYYSYSYPSHDLLPSHALSTGCESSGCHSAVMMREHAAPGRTDGAGAALSCSACHLSSRPEVQEAINVYPGVKLFSYGTITKEHSIPGKQITAARLQVDRQYNYATLEAFYGGAWNMVGTVWGSSSGPVSEDFAFPSSSSVRVTLVNQSAEYASGWLSDFEVTPPDNPVSCTSCHETVPDHMAVHDGTLDPFCERCHDANLRAEHEMKRSLSCADCHASEVSRVASATVSWDGECASCHDEPHAHPVSVGSRDCGDCHSLDLRDEHAARGLDCTTCHDSAANKVQRAISEGRTKCWACHPAPPLHHGDHYADGVPLTCLDCHELDLAEQHESLGGCGVCHDLEAFASPLSESWGQTCEQGPCHPGAGEHNDGPQPDPCLECHGPVG